MRIKICGIRNEQDMNTAVNAGADAVGGITGGLGGSAAELLQRFLVLLVCPDHVDDLAQCHEKCDPLGHTGGDAEQNETGNPLADIEFGLFGRLIFVAAVAVLPSLSGAVGAAVGVMVFGRHRTPSFHV